MARGAAVSHRALQIHRVNESLLRELIPAVIGVLVRRGADFASAEDAVQDALVRALDTWQDDPAAGPEGVARHRRVAQVPRPGARRDVEAGPGGRRRRRAAQRSGAGHRRHPRAVFPVRASVPVRVVGCRADAAGGRRSDDPADRNGVPRPRGDHGTADQQGQAQRQWGATGSARRSRHGAAGALPRFQRGVQR